MLLAEIGEYIGVARRSGRLWCMDGVTNKASRKLKIRLPGIEMFEPVLLYHDGHAPHYKQQPAAFRIDTLPESKTEFTVEMAPGGGFLIVATGS